MQPGTIEYSVYDMHWELIEKYDIYNIKLIERKVVKVCKDPADPTGKTETLIEQELTAKEPQGFKEDGTESQS